MVAYGYNKQEQRKGREAEDLMFDRNMKVLALCERTLKGKGEEFFGSSLCYKIGVGENN